MKNLDQYSSFISQYTELRIQENSSLNITFLNGNLVGNAKNITNGISARAYKNGSWGFASSSEASEEAIKAVIKSASENAVFLDSREKRNKPFFNRTAGSFEKNLGTQKSRLLQQEIMNFIREVDTYIASKYPNLSERVVSLRCLDMERSLITSDGAHLYTLLPRTNFIVSMTVDKNGEPISLYEVFGGLGQFEDVFLSPKDLYNKIDILYEHLIDKSEGVYAEAGLKECVLHANLAGILAHEAIGHTTEADLVLGGSVAGSNLNKQVASPLISLVDYAHTYEGNICPVPIFMDDEGVTAEDVVIIENGILKGFMHNKETARHFGDIPKGNARAFQFNDEPLIRMRNTAILPGKSKLSDMIASIEDGYYLMSTNNGQADTTSEFMFGIVLGYEIKNGKLGRAIKDTTISGIAFDVLKSVTMVSDDMIWLNGGMCGKKQPITVGMGGPALKCKVNIGGR
ncbi:TldD/PmbA family protein [Clostridium swellfunianum]|uniref:TldD/PmbA family protein n=1 Tax=Clostridium swellfunianum TaxID=1367462 RepID=UPI00202ECDE3|nr:TldD/PmbA family protein [Clostridium swellfunianum]MCM0648095.1 TldD/PmbA family protein [Clostridium swellfunianum]